VSDFTQEFKTVLFGLYGRRAFYFMGTLDNFYAKQHNTGFICRQIHTETGGDFFFPNDPNSAGPNILAWAEWNYFRATGDNSRLADAFWPLLAYHNWFAGHRRWPNGLYWATGHSSGMDNSPRIPDSQQHHAFWSWLDTSLQAALNCHILHQMAEVIGELDFIQPLVAEKLKLTQSINNLMWDNQTQFLYDLDPDGKRGMVKSIAAFWALLVPGLLLPEQQVPFIGHLRDPEQFNRAHPVPSLSADSDGYQAGGELWQGGVWPSTNYMVLKGLRQAGRHDMAHQLGLKHLEYVAEVYQRTDTFWSNYAPERAEQGSNSLNNYVGWTGLSAISILLEDVIGIQVDWPQRRVYWNQFLPCKQAYGVQQYPLGTDGTMNLLGDENQVTITTNVPFTLLFQRGATRLQMPAQIGTTTLDLS